MGLSISYKGRLNKKAELNNLIQELKDIAEIMEWPYALLDQDWVGPVDAKVDEEGGVRKITGNCGLKGISLTPHPYCETLNFYFNRNGLLRSPLQMASRNDSSHLVINTRFAGADTHVVIVKLLKHLASKYIRLKVRDEGKYWETGKMDVVHEKLNAANILLNDESVSLEKGKAMRVKMEQILSEA